MGKSPTEDRHRAWVVYTAIGQGIPGKVCSHLSSARKGLWRELSLDIGLLAPGTVRYMSVVSQPPIAGTVINMAKGPFIHTSGFD